MTVVCGVIDFACQSCIV